MKTLTACLVAILLAMPAASLATSIHDSAATGDRDHRNIVITSWGSLIFSWLSSISVRDLRPDPDRTRQFWSWLETKKNTVVTDAVIPTDRPATALPEPGAALLFASGLLIVRASLRKGRAAPPAR